MKHYNYIIICNMKTFYLFNNRKKEREKRALFKDILHYHANNCLSIEQTLTHKHHYSERV